MSSANYNIPEYPPDNSVIRQIFDWYAVENVSNEAARRIFEPVGKRILAGEFDRPCKRLPALFKMITMPLSAVALFAIVIGIAQPLPSYREFVDIQDAKIPTAATIPSGNTLSGRVISNGKSICGISLTLENKDKTESFVTIVTEADGFYKFNDIPDGTYFLKFTPDINANAWIMIGGKTEITFDSDSKNMWKGMDVHICRIGR